MREMSVVSNFGSIYGSKVSSSDLWTLGRLVESSSEVFRHLDLAAEKTRTGFAYSLGLRAIDMLGAQVLK